MTSDGPSVADLGHHIGLVALPLPIPRLPTVNAFVIDGGDGLTVIDCGVDSDEGWQALVSGLNKLGHDAGNVRTLVSTHLHVDHMGMARRVVEEVGARFVMHESAAASLDEYNDWTLAISWQAELAARHGASEADVDDIRDLPPRPKWAGTGIPPTDPVADGDRIELGDDRYLDVLHTPGHEAAHICLVDSRTGVLFSGDHILPRITPVVMHRPGDDRLGTYTDSLQRIEDLSIGLTYPAHGTIIERGSLRARQIILHHERRLGAIVQELRHGPKTAWEILEAIFRPNLIGLEKRLAFSETMAHLTLLENREEVTTFDEDGVVYHRIPPRRSRA